MKKLLTLMVVALSAIGVHAQDSMDKVMEKRARELQRVINLDKTEWVKFVRDNYAQALIDRPLKQRIDNPSGGSETSTAAGTTQEEKINAKAMMFNRMHDDFAGGKISSLKATGDKVDMVVTGDNGFSATFHLTFEKASPYLISGLGVEAQRN